MKVHIPTPLRPYADKQAVVEVAGRTAGEALANLSSQYPELRRHLYNEEGKLRTFVNFYLNDEDLRHLEKENTPATSSPSCPRSRVA